MIKKNLKHVIISSVLTLLPILAGLILWDKLPDQMPSHWNIQGEIDRYASKAFCVFGLPLIMFGLNLLCVVVTSFDKSNKNQNKKISCMVLYIVPVISIYCSAMVYSVALGYGFRVEKLIPGLLGAMLIIFGNYLPKCKQNGTIGIKVPWVYKSEEIWNKTHRFGGILWVVCGVVILLCVALPVNMMAYIFFPIILISVAMPIVYSYVLYRKMK